MAHRGTAAGYVRGQLTAGLRKSFGPWMCTANLQATWPTGKSISRKASARPAISGTILHRTRLRSRRDGHRPGSIWDPSVAYKTVVCGMMTAADIRKRMKNIRAGKVLENFG